MARLSGTLLSLLFLLPASTTAAGTIYTKSSPVLQVDAKSYGTLIGKSNYTSIVEFYAPWCGHCQNLKPAYEKAASTLAGLAQVAAINCDEDSNKPFCGQLGVQGFPTLKIVRPAKKAGGRAVTEDYQGPRTTKDIRDAVLEKTLNHVTRLKDDTLEAWIKKEPAQPKAIVFSDKAAVSAMIKAVAIDFLGALGVGQVRSTEKAAVKRFGITEFPTVMLLPDGEEANKVVFEGELKKEEVVKFLSQAASPNPPASAASPSAKSKKSSSEDSKTKEKKGKSKAKAQAKDKAKEPSGAHPKMDGDGAECPFASPDAKADPDAAKPVSVPVVPAAGLTTLSTADALEKACLHGKATTCILALVPDQTTGTGLGAEETETVEAAAELEAYPEPAHSLLQKLGELAHKHAQRGGKMFPFYTIPRSNPLAAKLLNSLDLSSGNGVGLGGDAETGVVALNAKRGWYSPYAEETVSLAALEAWVDKIRFGEAAKRDIPAGILVSAGDGESGEKARDEL